MIGSFVQHHSRCWAQLWSELQNVTSGRQFEVTYNVAELSYLRYSCLSRSILSIGADGSISPLRLLLPRTWKIARNLAASNQAWSCNSINSRLLGRIVFTVVLWRAVRNFSFQICLNMVIDWTYVNIKFWSVMCRRSTSATTSYIELHLATHPPPGSLRHSSHNSFAPTLDLLQ